MGAGQSNLEAMLGAVGDIYDDTPSRTDAFVDVETLPPVADSFRLVAAADPPPTREDKRIDERLQRAIALAATLGTAEGAAEADGAEGAEEAEGAEKADGAEGAEETGAAAEAEEADGAEGSEETEGSEDESTESAGESSDDEPDAEGAGFTIATCARAMGHEPVRLYPATAENVARVIGAGHAVLAVLSASEEAHVVVMRGYSGAAASFEATVFPPTGEPRDESIDARDLRFMYGFWHVRPRGPPAGAAEAER
jgi:hypothetical protein